MRVAVFSSKKYDQEFLSAANTGTGHELVFLEPRLTRETAPLAHGYPAICVFVNDQVNAPVIELLAAAGTQHIALRSAGFNHVDLAAAKRHKMTVTRVPAYSPYAVAEHAVGLVMALNRKLYRAYTRVREGNFALDGLLGFDLNGKTVGVVGTGKIGAVFARIMVGFGCRVLAVDPYPAAACQKLGVAYVQRDELLAQADVISLHCPLTPESYHLLDAQAFARMKRGVMVINTSRGALVDARAAIEALKTGQIGYLGLDVYEEEEELFFRDVSTQVIQDDVFARLLTFPNVLVTGHQAFFTREAVQAIAQTTLLNITAFERGQMSGNEVALS